jgi:hypothetical protein
MGIISESAFPPINQFSEKQVIEYLNDKIDQKLRFFQSRNEASINIGLSAHDEIRQIKNSLKLLEDSNTFSGTSEPLEFTKKNSISGSQLEQTFNELAKQWKEETINLSSTERIVLHTAYQEIIGLGPNVIPLVLKELEKEPRLWFWALRMLTRKNPVSENILGNLKAMQKAWLDWGRVNGLMAY